MALFKKKLWGVGISWTPRFTLDRISGSCYIPPEHVKFIHVDLRGSKKGWQKSTDSLLWYLLSKEHIFLMFLDLACWDRCHGFVRLFSFFRSVWDLVSFSFSISFFDSVMLLAYSILILLSQYFLIKIPLFFSFV